MTATPPVPVDAVTAPYWEACGRGELHLQQCLRCESYCHFPGLRCPRCGSAELGWRKMSGRGRIYSYVVIHQTSDPRFKPRVPYAVAWIELAESPSARVLGDLVDCDASRVRIGDAVEVRFDRSDPAQVVPRWTVVAPGPRAGISRP